LTHSKTCSKCGYVAASEAHSGGTATCTEQAECQHCGASYGEVDTSNHNWVNGVCTHECGITHDPHSFENGICTVCGASQTVVSVDISWSEMSFTYTDGEWQPERHTYADGKWTPDADGGNVITVQNNGNVAVNVTFAYNKTVTEVEGSFTDESDNAITSPFALAVEEEKKIKLILNGKPSSTLVAQTLGSVTVTITLPEEQDP